MPEREVFKQVVTASLFTLAISACSSIRPTATPTEIPGEPSFDITVLSIDPISPTTIAINFCTTGRPVGTTLRISARGIDDNTWQTIKELGVPCFNKTDRPIIDLGNFPNEEILVLAEARPDEAHGNWNDQSVKTKTISFSR